MTFSDVLAAIAVVLNGLPQGLLALTYGFAALPTAFAFGVGALGAALIGSVAPISFQAETIVMAGALGDSRLERVSMVFWSGVAMTVIGAFGLLNPTIDFIGPAILNGMLAGVGVILARTAINMIKDNSKIGATSLAIALLVYVLTNDLVYTIVASVIGSTLVNGIGGFKAPEADLSVNEKIKWINPLKSGKVIRGTLALVTLQIGGNIAYGSITAGLANVSIDIDHLTVYSGIASVASAGFGGAPVEAIISGTAAAPNPVTSGVLMMVIFTVVLLLGLLPRLAKYVPTETIAGFLFVLGALVVFPSNMGIGLESNSLLAGVTAVVTASTDPFIGMIAGVVLKGLFSITGGI